VLRQYSLALVVLLSTMRALVVTRCGVAENWDVAVGIGRTAHVAERMGNSVSTSKEGGLFNVGPMTDGRTGAPLADGHRRKSSLSWKQVLRYVVENNTEGSVQSHLKAAEIPSDRCNFCSLPHPYCLGHAQVCTARGARGREMHGHVLLVL